MPDSIRLDPPSSGEDFAWDMGIAHAFRSKDGPGSDEGPSIEETGYCGRYRLVGEIARGGIGVVYRAMDETLEREVAVKILRNRYAKNDGMIRRFLNEAQICASLRHPGIVPVHEMGMALRDRPFFSMKLIEGETLANLLAGRSDPESERMRYVGIVEQICLALAYAHSRDVIHRDVKPGNSMVGAFGELQILDWGFAKRLTGGDVDDSSTSATGRLSLTGVSSIAGSILGTPSYMSPEQARGEVGDLDERCDVFALGAIMAEVLTGSRPDTRRREDEPLERSVEKTIAETKRRLEVCDADPDLVALAASCLAADREARPKDASVVAEALGRYRAEVDRRLHESEMVAAEARGRAEEERKAHRLAMAVSYLVLVAIILGAGVIWGLDSARRQGQLREDRTVRAGVAEASAHIARLEWEKAEEAIDRAQGHVSDETDREVAKQFMLVKQALGESRATAAKEERIARRNETLLARLRRVTSLPATTGNVHARFATAIGSVGLDLVSLADPKARHDEELLGLVLPALDDWLVRTTTLGRSTSAAVMRALDVVDPDPTRRRIRRSDSAALLSIASSFVPRADGPETAMALARRLASIGQIDVAADILAKAAAAYPRSRALHDTAATILGGGLDTSANGTLSVSAKGNRLIRAISHATAAAALADDDFAREQLAALLRAAGRDQEADAALRR